jgi:hypothetical protein
LRLKTARAAGGERQRTKKKTGRKPQKSLTGRASAQMRICEFANLRILQSIIGMLYYTKTIMGQGFF